MEDKKYLSEFKNITKEQFVNDFDNIISDVENNQSSYLIRLEENQKVVLMPINEKKVPIVVNKTAPTPEQIKRQKEYDEMLKKDFDYERFDTFDDFLSKYFQKKTK